MACWRRYQLAASTTAIERTSYGPLEVQMDWQQQRSRYSYPPARLRRVSVANDACLSWPAAGLHFEEDCPENVRWRVQDNRSASSSLELDQYHQELLASDNDDNAALLALISV